MAFIQYRIQASFLTALLLFPIHEQLHGEGLTTTSLGIYSCFYSSEW